MTTDHSTGAGGLVKKLLFPASASGANDTFVLNNGQVHHRHNPSPKSSNAVRRSPEGELSTRASTASPGGRHSSSHNNYHQSPLHQQHPSLYATARQPNSSTTIASAVNPPRFFSSTHPCQGGEQHTRTTKRHPSSPPRLATCAPTRKSPTDTRDPKTNIHRKLLHHSSSLNVEISQQDDESDDKLMSSYAREASTASPRSRSFRPITSSPIVDDNNTTVPDPVNFDHDDGDSSASSEADHHTSSGPLHTNNFPYDLDDSNHDGTAGGDDEKKDDSFDNDEDAEESQYDDEAADTLLPRRDTITPKKSDEDGDMTEIHDNRTAFQGDGEETEIHDNTTSALKQQQHHRQQHQDKEEQTHRATTPLEGKTTTARRLPMETPPSDYFDNEDLEEASRRPSYFPSFYDDPVHNPLVASALKPHSLFRNSSLDGNNNKKDNDNNAVNTTIDASSEINSNCSEMGTVIGAPGTIADRFAEVDSMERAVANANFVTTGDETTELFKEEELDDDDPSITNYQVFRAHDDDGDNTGKDWLASPVTDEYRTPATAKSDAQSGQFQTLTTHKKRLENPERSNRPVDVDDHWKNVDQAVGNESDEGCIDDSASSIVDSEIDQLIRRSASASTLPTVIGRSNTSGSNSSAVFRRPASTCTFGTLPKKDLTLSLTKTVKHTPANGKGASHLFVPILSSGKKSQKQHSDDRIDDDTEDHQLDEEISKFHPNNGTQKKALPNSSLQLAQQSDRQQEVQGKHTMSEVAQPDQEESTTNDEGHEHEESTKGSDTDTHDDNYDAFNSSNMAAVGTDSSGIVNVIRRIGSNFTKLSAPATPSTGLHDAFLFDIDKDHDRGDIFTHEGRGRRTMSAPTTPQPCRLSRGPHNLSKIQEAFGLDASETPASGSVLRSPGSPARVIADFRRSDAFNTERNLADGRIRFRRNRIAEWGRKIIHSPNSQSLGTRSFQHQDIARQMTDNSLTEEISTPNHRSLVKRPNPFRGCLSFDTTMDQQYDVAYRYDPSQVFAVSNRHDEVIGRHHRASTVEHPALLAASTLADRSKDVGSGRTQALYGSKSWDLVSGFWSATTGGRGSAEGIHLSTEKANFRDTLGYNNPRSNKGSNHTPEVVLTPQRIEIEREDALDILSCLVERGVSLPLKDEAETQSKVRKDGKPSPNYEAPSAGTADDSGLAHNEGGNGRLHNDDTDDLREAVNALRKISGEYRGGAVVVGEEALSDHPSRIAVLDLLLRSHTYALEMKRASVSASAWLRSIGRNERTKDIVVIEGTQADDGDSLKEDRMSASGQAAGEREVPPRQEDSSTKNSDNQMGLLALKAMLHQAQMEVQEKEALARRLNDELSNCRAEIGRLQTAAAKARTKKSFTSPNRSMLDEALDDESVASASSSKVRGGTFNGDAPTDEGAFGGARTSPIFPVDEDGIGDLNSSMFSNGAAAEIVRETDQPWQRELVKFKSALSDANAVIRKLHVELQVAKADGCDTEAPVINVSDEAFSRALADESQSHQNKSSDSDGERYSDYRTVNVRMLDGENFVTEWDDITPPLPPPPDHGLHSPIVMALLQQWTDDPALHDSLLSWMERVMSGEDPSAVPPLTLSSLDHQLRDGFTMHVLPLLLRRSDILVEVKTRAHRRTAYDIAVSVHNLPPTAPIRHMESTAADDVNSVYRSDGASGVDSVTHSAVTAHIRNIPPDHLFEVGSTAASYASLGSQYDAGVPHAGIMSALGGAIGGLLSRRKNSSSSQFHDCPSLAPGVNAVSSDDLGSAAGAAGQGPMDYPHSPGAPPACEPMGSGMPRSDTEPYHRLVSAPPGRIGVSFVEFRGHAMVSDVAEDSPLLGWIFPSDILIALDEVPVAGMRLREIIKLLTQRKNRQRAMRVISSHAMNEFTNMNLSGGS